MVKGDDGSLYMGNRDGFDSHTDVVAMPFSRCTSSTEVIKTRNLNPNLNTRYYLHPQRDYRAAQGCLSHPLQPGGELCTGVAQLK